MPTVPLVLFLPLVKCIAYSGASLFLDAFTILIIFVTKLSYMCPSFTLQIDFHDIFMPFLCPHNRRGERTYCF